MKEQALWDQVDKVWVEADKVFELADEIFKEARNEVRGETVTSKECHTVRFKAADFDERRRLSGRFLRMAWQCLWRGKTEFKFRQKHENHRVQTHR